MINTKLPEQVEDVQKLIAIAITSPRIEVVRERASFSPTQWLTVRLYHNETKISESSIEERL